MPRFFVPTPLQGALAATLPERVARHVQVLRLKAGDPVVLFDGSGAEFEGVLVFEGKKTVRVEALQAQTPQRESALPITLLQAVSANEYMELALQKSVELGVARIVPVFSARTPVRLSGERADKKHARWREIVVSACEQCGRTRIPELLPAAGLDKVLEQTQFSGSLKLMMSLGRQVRRFPEFARPQALTLLIGPEGGLSPEEEAAALQAGFCGVSLGPRVLRTETATTAALTAAQLLWGDL